MLKKGVAGKIAVLAWDVLNDTEKTGDQANITAQVSLDGGSAAASNDTNPTQLDATNLPGVYVFDMTAAEMNCEMLVLKAKSSTANIKIDPIFAYPQPDPPATFSTVNDAGASTTDFDTALTEATDDHYNNMYIVFLSGVLTGQSRKISDYVGSSKNITVATAFTDAPSTSDRFVILGRSE